MAHTYSHLYRLPTTGLRFFTVYGPWGVPIWRSTSSPMPSCKEKPIDVYNHGQMKRDFTYVDDITEAVQAVMDRVAQPNPNWSAKHPDPSSSNAPYRIFNIGNHQPTELSRFIEVLEDMLGQKR